MIVHSDGTTKCPVCAKYMQATRTYKCMGTCSKKCIEDSLRLEDTRERIRKIALNIK